MHRCTQVFTGAPDVDMALRVTCSAASRGSANLRPRQISNRPSPAYETVGDTSTPSAASTFPPAANTHLRMPAPLQLSGLVQPAMQLIGVGGMLTAQQSGRDRTSKLDLTLVIIAGCLTEHARSALCRIHWPSISFESPSAHPACSCMTSRRAVSGESSASPGPFFRGENCSARGTSISETALVSGKVSKMNSSSLMPCSRAAQSFSLPPGQFHSTVRHFVDTKWRTASEVLQNAGCTQGQDIRSTT